jgi:pimeloyl-ACP methyl ester carboxylesterase
MGGAKLRVRVAGAGPAVMFIHGWALDLDIWAPQFHDLARRFRTIAFDRRGFGLSTGNPSLGQDAHDLWRVVDSFGIHRCALVGMSQGARVALRCAIATPERVTRLIVDGPPAEGLTHAADAPSELPMEHYRDIARTKGLAAVRRALRRHRLMRLHTRRRGARALLGRIINRYPALDLLQRGRLEAPWLPGRIRGCDMPVLVINGERDSRLRREAGALLAGRLPRASRVVIPGAGHLANLDRPEAYNHVLSGFLMARAGS